MRFFKKKIYLQNSDSVRRSSSLTPASHANDLLTRFDESVLFTVIHAILDSFIHILGPIFGTLL